MEDPDRQRKMDVLSGCVGMFFMAAGYAAFHDILWPQYGVIFLGVMFLANAWTKT